MLKEFSSKNSSKAFLISGIFAIIGVGFMFLSLYIGIAIVIAAVGLFFVLHNSRNYTKVVCKDDGFTVKIVNKYSKPSVHEFSWSDVKETRYYEREFVEEHHSSAYYFQVKTKKGIAFNLPMANHLDELIEIFNKNADHLPYQWVKQKGMFAPYQKIDRNEQ